MSISGNLKTMELAELFQWLSHGGKTGTLVINNGIVEKRIYFRDGSIIATASSNPKEYLGHFLVSHGYIDEHVLAKAMEMQDANKMLLGKILVTIGAIGEDDLDRMLRLKSEETVYEVFTWPEGDFRFHDGELHDFHMIPMSLEVTGLVLEGAQRVDDWGRIRGRISSDQMVPVAVGELEPPRDDDRARHILTFVDDDRSIEEIALHSHSSEFHVFRVLFDQLQRGRIKLVRPRSIAAADPPERGGEAVGSGSLIDAADAHLKAERFELALRHLRAAVSLEPDDKKIQSTVKRAHGVIVNRVRDAGLKDDAVPVLERTFEELTSLDITPQEGFILTRINGSYDIQTLLKISPMPALDARLVLFRLLEAGHISLRPRSEEG